MFGWNRRKGCENKECEKQGKACHHPGSGRRHGIGQGNGYKRHHHSLNLNEGELDKKYYVVCNPDRKTMEMGIYNGSAITVQKNEQTDPNIVVGVGESRYILPKTLAQTIIIK